MEKTPKKRTPKADRSEPAPGPNGRLLQERTKRQGSIRSLPAPSAEAAPRFAFWPAPGLPLKSIPLLPESTKRQGSICSAPAPAAD